MYRIGVFVLTLSVCLSACVAELTICERNPIHTTAEKSKGDNGFQISLLELDSKKNEKFKSSQNYTGNNIFFLSQCHSMYIRNRMYREDAAYE